METILNNLGQLIYINHNHKGFLIKWNLLAPLCKKWSRNRDCDMTRVLEMLTFHKMGGYIPRMIHLAELPKEGLVCYDGNHRREVFTLCNDEEIICIVDVLFNTNQKEVYDAFDNINKSVQVPAIYLEDTTYTVSIKEDILALVKEYEIKYKPFLSTSSRCHAPNFNRDMFTDMIHGLYTFFQGTLSICQLKEILEQLNIEYSKENNIFRPHSCYRKTIIEKCKTNNFWLFLEKSIPIEHIQKQLKV